MDKKKKFKDGASYAMRKGDYVESKLYHLLLDKTCPLAVSDAAGAMLDPELLYKDRLAAHSLLMLYHGYQSGTYLAGWLYKEVERYFPGIFDGVVIEEADDLYSKLGLDIEKR